MHSRGLGEGVLLAALLLGCGSSSHGSGHATNHDDKPAPERDAGHTPSAMHSSDAATDPAVMQDAARPSSDSVDAGTSAPAMDAGCAGVDCPQCDLGERPVMMAGQCCPVACEKIPNVDPGSDLDAGTCVAAPLPTNCMSNNWPYCTAEWPTAMDWYPGCPSPNIGAYLAKCGTLDAIIVPVMGGSRRYFYDAFGRLFGFESVLDEAAHCEAYDPAFVVPDAPCVPLDAPCPEVEQPMMTADLASIGATPFVTWDGGTPDCATGQTAYRNFLVSQLQQFNTCVDSSQCAGGFPEWPMNPCDTPCDVVFSPAGINSQILSRLDTFGFVACGACQNGPGAGCPFGHDPKQCVSSHCEP